MICQMKRYIRWGMEVSQTQDLLSPWSCGTSPSWYMDVFTNLEPLWTPCYWDFMEAATHRHDQLLSPFPALSPLWRTGGGAGNPKLLIMVWSFWWLVPIQEPSTSPPSHLIGKKDALSALIKNCARNGDKDLIYISYKSQYHILSWAKIS